MPLLPFSKDLHYNVLLLLAVCLSVAIAHWIAHSLPPGVLGFNYLALNAVLTSLLAFLASWVDRRMEDREPSQSRSSGETP